MIKKRSYNLNIDLKTNEVAVTKIALAREVTFLKNTGVKLDVCEICGREKSITKYKSFKNGAWNWIYQKSCENNSWRKSKCKAEIINVIPIKDKEKPF